MTDATRGQTTIDFTIGITIFLIVLATVFAFVPGALQPFNQGTQEDIVTVNRVADTISEDNLADPTQPYLLDTACTIAFFEDPSTTPSDCEYPSGDLKETVGIGEGRHLNVTIRGNVSGAGDPNQILCWQQPSGPLDVPSNCGGSDPVLALGGNPPGGSQSAVTARRVVQLDDRDVFLVVKLW